MRLSQEEHRHLIEKRRNLGEGIFPPGSPEREMVVGFIWWAVRDYFDGDPDALGWLKSAEADDLLRWIGIPQTAFVVRLREVAHDPEQRALLSSRLFGGSRARALLAGAGGIKEAVVATA